jgi:hypothetical protein
MKYMGRIRLLAKIPSKFKVTYNERQIEDATDF